MSFLLSKINLPRPFLTGLDQIIQKTQQSWMTLSRMFKEYESLFAVFTMFKSFTGENDSIQQAFRYGWILFLDAYSQHPLQEKELKTLVILTAAFITIQVNQARPLCVVLKMLDVQLENTLMNQAWTVQLLPVLERLIIKLGLTDVANQVTPMFLGLLDVYKQKNCLNSMEPDVMGPLTKVYQGAFDLKHFLDMNMQNLSLMYTQTAQQQNAQFDWRGFAPNQSSEMTNAPKRLIRTPFNTGLRSVSKVRIPLGSSMAQHMLATPLSMRGRAPPTTVGNTIGEVRVELTSFLSNKSCNPSDHLSELGYQQSVPAEVFARIKNVTDYFCRKYPGAKQSLELGVRLYGAMLANLYKHLPDPSWQARLLGDRNFQRCMVCISLEFVRHTFESETFLFGELLSYIQAPLIDLCLAVDILVHLDATWLPRFLQKRLLEIQERIMEADLWEDTVFCHFLQQKESSFTSETSQLHHVIMTRQEKSYESTELVL